jgi:hypothetical protein
VLEAPVGWKADTLTIFLTRPFPVNVVAAGHLRIDVPQIGHRGEPWPREVAQTAIGSDFFNDICNEENTQSQRPYSFDRQTIQEKFFDQHDVGWICVPCLCNGGELSHYVPGRCGSSINPFDAIWMRGPTRWNLHSTVLQGFALGLLGLVDMHMYGLVAAEDGEAPSGHMWRRMSSLSVAVRGDCLEFVPRRPVRTKSQ